MNVDLDLLYLQKAILLNLCYSEKPNNEEKEALEAILALVDKIEHSLGNSRKVEIRSAVSMNAENRKGVEL